MAEMLFVEVGEFTVSQVPGAPPVISKFGETQAPSHVEDVIVALASVIAFDAEHDSLWWRPSQNVVN